MGSERRNRNRIRWATCFACWLFAVACYAQTANPKSIVDIHVVNTETKDDGWCSGAVVQMGSYSGGAWFGRVITAAHCATAGNRIFVNDLDADLVFVDEGDDVAILNVDDFIAGTPAIELARHAPKSGAPITAWGYPYDSEAPIPLTGYVLNPENRGMKNAPTPRLEFNILVFPRMSGGPILDKDGRLVSVISARAPVGSDFIGLGFGANYKAVRAIMHKAGLD